MSEARELYLNDPQLKAMLIDAHDSTHVWGRGTGKSSNLLLPRLMRCAFSMPRSLGAMVGASFAQMLTKTLNELETSLAAYGYVRDRDYVYGGFAPKAWGWERPYSSPTKPEYFIHFRNGSGMVLISQDRKGSANGLSLDWGVADEGRLLRRDRYMEEYLPAIRGNQYRFQDCHLHGSTMLATDRPRNKAGKWILERKKAASTPEFQRQVEIILAIQKRIYQLQSEQQTSSPSMARVLQESIQSLNNKLLPLRRGDLRKGIQPLSYYSEASAYDNRHVLGAEYFVKMKRLLSPEEYAISIENKNIGHGGDRFYPDLDQDRHGYLSTEFSLMDYSMVGSDRDSRFDGDVNPNEPIDIAGDYGGSFNCLIAGQFKSGDYHFLKNFYRCYPDKIKDVVLDFKRYYQGHKARHVRYFYDNTTTGTSGIDSATYASTVIDTLQDPQSFGAWTVEPVYIGQQPRHHVRYELWGSVLREEDPDVPRFRYNVDNCDQWATSANMAPQKQGRMGVEKDKTSERRNKEGLHEDQQDATHLSDAGDTLLYAAITPVMRQRGIPEGGDTLMG